MSGCRECAGLPLHTPRCALCAVLCRLGEVGHRGVFSTSNQEGLVNRLRLLHSEALDIIDSGSPAVAAAKGDRTKPPETWEGASPAAKVEAGTGLDSRTEDKVTKVQGTTSGTPSTTRSKEAAGSGECEAAPEVAKVDSSSPKEGFIEVEVEEDQETGEEEEPEEDSEVLPELQGVKTSKVEEKKEESKRESQVKEERRRDRGSSKTKVKNSPRPERKRERSNSRRGGLRLRPKSPSYPPPKHRKRIYLAEKEDERSDDRWEDWDSGSNRHPQHRAQDSGLWKKRSKGQTRVHRWEDIRKYGPDPSRKEWRESSRSWKW